MTRGLRAAISRHPFLTAAFALALALTLVFAARSIVFAVYWSDPAHRDQPIEGWMTPRYVAHSWHLPPKVLREAMGSAATQRGDRRTLEDIAHDAGIPLATLIEDLEAAARAHHGSGE